MCSAIPFLPCCAVQVQNPQNPQQANVDFDGIVKMLREIANLLEKAGNCDLTNLCQGNLPCQKATPDERKAYARLNRKLGGDIAEAVGNWVSGLPEVKEESEEA